MYNISKGSDAIPNIGGCYTDDGASSYRRFLDGDDGYYNKIDDLNVVSEIADVIQLFYAYDVDSIPEVGVAPNGQTQADATEYVGYTLTFTAQNGEKAVFILTGNRLISTDDRQELTLSEKKLSALKNILGLPNDTN